MGTSTLSGEPSQPIRDEARGWRIFMELIGAVVAGLVGGALGGAFGVFFFDGSGVHGLAALANLVVGAGAGWMLCSGIGVAVVGTRYANGSGRAAILGGATAALAGIALVWGVGFLPFADDLFILLPVVPSVAAVFAFERSIRPPQA